MATKLLVDGSEYWIGMGPVPAVSTPQYAELTVGLWHLQAAHIRATAAILERAHDWLAAPRATTELPKDLEWRRRAAGRADELLGQVERALAGDPDDSGTWTDRQLSQLYDNLIEEIGDCLELPYLNFWAGPEAGLTDGWQLSATATLGVWADRISLEAQLESGDDAAYKDGTPRKSGVALVGPGTSAAGVAVRCAGLADLARLPAVMEYGLRILGEGDLMDPKQELELYDRRGAVLWRGF
jgi:hypothetical protein